MANREGACDVAIDSMNTPIRISRNATRDDLIRVVTASEVSHLFGPGEMRRLLFTRRP
jgi:hypothetical protein